MSEPWVSTPNLWIHRAVAGALANNAYLLTCRQTGGQVLIDAPGDGSAIDTLLASAGPTALQLIVITHQHRDHIEALCSTYRLWQAPIAAGDADVEAIVAATGVPVHHSLRHGQSLTVGALALDVIALRGHTPGSIALALHTDSGEMIFTGDSLFPGGLGNTDHDPSRFARLFLDVSQRIFERFDDHAIIAPGHGEATTLGIERPHLGEWQQRGW